MKTRSVVLISILLAGSAGSIVPANAQLDSVRLATVSPLAGTGDAGAVDGLGGASSLNRPHGITVSASGEIIVADRGNHLIRKIKTDGTVVTLAGTGKAAYAEGSGAKAAFNEPIAVAVDRKGNIFVADRNNHRVREITSDGTVKTLAGSGEAGFVDGYDHKARFNQPYGVALDDAEITLYVADYLNHSIRAINLLTDQVSTLAGNGKAGFADGMGEAAAFNQPYNLKNDGHGALIVPDQSNHAVRRVAMSGAVTTLAGSGTAGYAEGKGREAQFNNPTGAVAMPDGTVIVADRNNHRVRSISPDGTVMTIAGTGEAAFGDGAALKAKFNRPLDVDLLPGGRIAVSEENNHRIRVIGR